MNNRRSDPSYYGATAPYLDQEPQYDAPPTNHTPITMNALFPVGAESTETNTSTAATRPISHSNAVPPRVAVQHPLPHSRPHPAPVSAVADESTAGPSLAIKLQQIGFWNILMVVVATVVTLIVAAVVVSNRSDTSKSLSTDSSNRSTTRAPIPIRPSYAKPTAAPVYKRPTVVTSVVPSILASSTGVCGYGNAAIGIDAFDEAQLLPFNESGLTFTVNGQAVTEAINMTLQGQVEHTLAIVRTTPFVAALIRLSLRQFAGDGSFEPVYEDPYHPLADSQASGECTNGRKGVTDLGTGSTTSVTGVFVTWHDNDILQVDVVAALTGTTDRVDTYTYGYFEFATVPKVRTVSPVATATLLPTATPPPSYATKCHVCGNPDWVISLPDATVVLSSVVTTCADMAQRSALSLVPPEECADAIAQVVEHCGCQRAPFNGTTPNDPNSGPIFTVPVSNATNGTSTTSSPTRGDFFTGEAGCVAGRASGDWSEWNVTEVVPFEQVVFTINDLAVSMDQNVTLETRGNYNFAVVTLDGDEPAFARALIRVSQGDSDNTFTFEPYVSTDTDNTPVDSQVALACLPPASGVTDLETGNATSVTGRFVSLSTGDLVLVDVTVIWIDTMEGTASYAHHQYQFSTRLPTSMPLVTSTTAPALTP